MPVGGTPPPFIIPPKQRGGGEIQPSKNCAKKRRVGNTHDHLGTRMNSDVTSATSPLEIEGVKDRYGKVNLACRSVNLKGGKQKEGEGGGAGGTHHGTSTFVLSFPRHLLQMRANVDLKDRAMRVPQGCLRLRDMPVSGAVCHLRAPHLVGRDAEQRYHGGKGDREAQAVARENEGGTAVATHDASATRESGAGERRGQVGQEQGDGDATRGGQGDGGRRARL